MKHLQILFIIISASTLALGETCGGLLESDGGKFGLPQGDIIPPGKVCVWIVKLVSRQTIRFNLQELGQGLNVSLYGEHNPSETSLQPVRLTRSDVGRDIDINGHTLVIALTQGGSGQGFSFSWDSLESESSGIVTAANYIDTESGEVLWNRFSNRERLTLSLNTDQLQSLDIETDTYFMRCDVLSDCECSYFGVYEFRNDGSLREVSKACGRPSQVKVQHLYPNVLVLVYLNSAYTVSSTDYAEIKWNASSIQSPPPVTTPVYETSPTTPVLPNRDCGGVIDIRRNEISSIEFLPEGGYRNYEYCIWTTLPRDSFNQTEVYIQSYGIEDGYDGINVLYWNASGILSSRKIKQSEFGQRLLFDAPNTAIAFSSDGHKGGVGFVATIRGLGQSDAIYTNQAFVFNGTEGNFSYPIDPGCSADYSNNERTSIAFQFTTFQRLSINFADLQDDTIKVYLLYRYYVGFEFSEVGSATGSHPEGIPSLETTDGWPRLILFASNEGNTGKGFQLSWTTTNT